MRDHEGACTVLPGKELVPCDVLEVQEVWPEKEACKVALLEVPCGKSPASQ